jgi:REP element-mobilizing transposase RayT
LQIEDDRERRAELEGYLDRDQGGCHLRRSEISRLVENSLRWFHGDRYDLRAWCIMGNHVHVLFMVGEVPLSEIIESWKKHTSIKSNRLLNRKGAFWAPGYFDTYMRDAEHEQTTIRYIENNPTKSKLVLDPKGWPWSSARFRNEFGALKL